MWVFTDPMALMPYNIMGSLIVLVILGVVAHAVTKTMSVTGLLAMLALIGVSLWTVQSMISFDFVTIGFWSWATQPLAALILTVGWQWPKIWRKTTGVVTVEDPDTPA
jgi:hypothetical protein